MLKLLKSIEKHKKILILLTGLRHLHLINSNYINMKTKFNGILTLLLALSVQFVFAQKTVSGTVADESGPLPGVNIIIKGTTSGTDTDFDGNYSIDVNQGDVLVFSYVGMVTVEKTVGTENTIDVTMTAENVLDEVVIVGYGKTIKEAFTGTATKVESKNLETKTSGNVSQAIKGEVAGVNVVSTNGAPGSDATIRIRGFGSVNGNQAPLYIVDGAPYASDLSAINPSDIESMTILKDAAATSIYGSRGANGVIVITTKKGKIGQPSISVDAKTSFNTLFLPTYDVIESPEEYIELSWSALKQKAMLSGQADPATWAGNNLYGTPEGIDTHYNIWNAAGNQLIDPATGKFNSGIDRLYTPTKWADAAFGTGVRQEANIQLSGGSDKTRYATSIGYLDDAGYAINSNYTRYTTRVNLEHSPKEWITVGGNMSFTNGKYTNSTSDENRGGSSSNIFALTSTTPTIYDVYLRDDDGNLVPDPIYGGYQFDYGGDYGRRVWTNTNGIADANYNLSRTNRLTFMGNFNIGVDFTDWLSLDLRYTGQYDNRDRASRANPFYGGSASVGGTLYKTLSENINHNFLQLLRFTNSFGDHSLEAFVAHETTENKYLLSSAGKQKAILFDTTDLAQYTTPIGQAESYTLGWTLESFFSQVNYNYLQKYFLTGSVRRDGSSRFYKDKWGTFGSVGLGWVVSKEDFFSADSFMNHLKFKASYGIIGDQGRKYRYGWQIFTINETPDGTYSFTESFYVANPDLTWETSKIAQVGVETGFFDDRLTLDLDYYIKNTENLFFTQTLPPSSGYQYRDYNDGQLRNSGFEFSALANLVNKDDFKLSFGFNGEIFNNEITKMPLDFSTGEPKILDDNLSEGHSIYDWYMREWAGVNPDNGAAQWNLYYDDVDNNGEFGGDDIMIESMTKYLHDYPDANVQQTVTETYADATQKYVDKSAIPLVRGGFRINAGLQRFDLTAQFSYSIGGYVYDSGYRTLMQNDLIGSYNWHTDIRDAWQQPGDVTDVPRNSANYGSDTSFTYTSTRFLTDATFLSLNNLSLGYNLPQSYTDKMGLAKLNLYISGDNLMMLSARKGLNPSTMLGASNSGIYMPMSTFSLGAKILF